MKNQWKLIFGCVFLAGNIASMALAQNQTPPSFKPGETIVYDIKKVGLRVGRTTIVYQGPAKIEGKPAILIEVRSKGIKFFDNEKIYVDPETYYPMVVERDVDALGKKEKIKEYYDQAKGSIRIVKTAEGKTTEQTIQRKAPVENIYGFLFRYRTSAATNVGDSVHLRLPTKEVDMKVLEKNFIQTAKGEVQAIHLRSEPRGYEIWFEDDQKKIPLRIDGAVGFGKTAMVFRESFFSVPK